MPKKYEVYDEHGRKIGIAEEKPTTGQQVAGAFILLWLIWEFLKGIGRLIIFLARHPKIGIPLAVIAIGIIGYYGIYPEILQQADEKQSWTQTLGERELSYNSCIEETTTTPNIDSTNVEAYYRRGECYAGIDWYHPDTKYNDSELRDLLEQALADFNKTLEIDPTYTKSYADMGLVYERLGREQEALAAYKAFVENPPPDTYSQTMSAVYDRIHELEWEVSQGE